MEQRMRTLREGAAEIRDPGAPSLRDQGKGLIRIEVVVVRGVMRCALVHSTHDPGVLLVPEAVDRGAALAPARVAGVVAEHLVPV